MNNERIDCVVIIVSDRASRGERADATAALLRPALDAAGFELVETVTVPDECAAIGQALIASCEKAGLVLTTGGTGVAPRDVTPEATREVLEIEIPGLAEEMRRRSLEVTDKALGSRATAGARGQAVILNLPGRPAGAVECFGFVAAAIPHLVALRRGPVPDASHEPGG